MTLGSVAAAFAASVSGGDRSRARVASLIEGEFAPRELLLLDSGTSALQLALLAVRRESEERGRSPVVALPAYGCLDLATAAIGAGVHVVLYDLDPATLGPSWPSLEATLAHEPAAIVAAHLHGIPVDVARIGRLAPGAVVIDDAAQGIGALAGGRPLGTAGTLGVLSFGRGKGRTGGGGGALLANDERGVALLARVSNQVKPARRGVKAALGLKAQWLFGRPTLYWIPASMPFLGLGDTPFHAPHAPRRMDDACAAALAAAWHDAVREVDARRIAARAWRRAAASRDWLFPDSDASDVVRGELRLPALVPSHEVAAVVARNEQSGIMPGYPTTLAKLPALAGRLEHPAPSPGAELLVARLLTLPCHRYTSIRISK